MKVKICGITDTDTAMAAVDYGADAIGFVFAESKRKINLEKAFEIAKALPSHILKIGVFVNESKEAMERIASEIGFTHLQLHGEETPEFCKSLSFPVIKAFSIQEISDLEKIWQFPCQFILLDGPIGQYRGGNGESFDWGLFDPARFSTKQLILAGGLNIDNVQEGIRRVRPAMVDVSSGVETSGQKDLQKMKLFIRKVKEIEHEGEI